MTFSIMIDKTTVNLVPRVSKSLIPYYDVIPGVTGNFEVYGSHTNNFSRMDRTPTIFQEYWMIL